MTSLMSVLEGWQDQPVTPVRTPFWLGEDDRAVMAETIITLFDSATLFPSIRNSLDAVLTELGVVEARNRMWPERADIVRRVHGHSADVLPIRMSSEERDAVLSIPILPETLRNKLTGAHEKK